jgi:hypothetical protein
LQEFRSEITRIIEKFFHHHDKGVWLKDN